MTFAEFVTQNLGTEALAKVKKNIPSMQGLWDEQMSNHPNRIDSFKNTIAITAMDIDDIPLESFRVDKFPL